MSNALWLAQLSQHIQFEHNLNQKKDFERGSDYLIEQLSMSLHYIMRFFLFIKFKQLAKCSLNNCFDRIINSGNKLFDFICENNGIFGISFVTSFSSIIVNTSPVPYLQQCLLNKSSVQCFIRHITYNNLQLGYNRDKLQIQP